MQIDNIEAAHKRIAEISSYVAQKIEAPADLSVLVQTVYAEYLALSQAFSPLNRGGKPAEIKLMQCFAKDFQLADYSPSAGIRFLATLRITLSSAPPYVIEDKLAITALQNVLIGFNVRLVYCHEDGVSKQFVLTYEVDAQLANLPKMTESLTKFKGIRVNKVVYDRVIAQKQRDSLASDDELARLRLCAEAALTAKALADSQSVRAAGALLAHEEALKAKVVAQTPFAHEFDWNSLSDRFVDTLTRYRGDELHSKLSQF